MRSAMLGLKERSALLAREGVSWNPALEEALVARAEERENEGNWSGALLVYEVILNLAEAAGDKRALAEALRDLGYGSAELQDYKAALEYQGRALVLAEERQDVVLGFKDLSHLALVQRQPEKALDLARRCSALARQYQSPAILWQCLALEGRAQILEACEKGDGPGAVRILQDHVATISAEIAECLAPPSAR